MSNQLYDAPASSLFIITFVGSSGPIQIGDNVWRHVSDQFGVSKDDCGGGFCPRYCSTPEPKTLKRSFGFRFSLDSSQEELFRPHSSAMISHMLENNSSHCRFMLKTSSLGASAVELSCIHCNIDPTPLQDTSSDLPSTQGGGSGLLYLPFPIYQDGGEIPSTRGQAVAPGRPLTVRSKSSIRM